LHATCLTSAREEERSIKTKAIVCGNNSGTSTKIPEYFSNCMRDRFIKKIRTTSNNEIQKEEKYLNVRRKLHAKIIINKKYIYKNKK
jgi:hypothetical protein